jgi:PAS domain S-box-containing protein
MVEKKAPHVDETELRRLAKERLEKSTETGPGAAVDAQRLLQELEIHKIELEMQNAELAKVRDDVEAALEKYTHLYDFAPVGYLTVNRCGTIQNVNLTGADLLGIERWRLKGRQLEPFIADASRGAFDALLERVFAVDGKETCELALLNQGRPRPLVQIEAVVSGEECHIALMDITKRKDAEQDAAKALRREKEAAQEELLKQRWAAEALEKVKAAAEALRIELQASKSLRLEKEAAEETARAKSQFLANMSHELRTPMTGILGMLQLALDEEIAPVPRRYLETTLGSARSLLRILNDILDMAKMDAGKLTIERHTFSLAGCIDEAADLFTPELLRKGLDFDVSFADGVPDAVLGDQLRLRQILVNLIGNAVKFTQTGKVVLRLNAGPSTLTGEREFTFSVTDTGIGIPENKKELLFQAFSQVDASHSRSFGGTGLGLAISRELLELMGGTICFESEEGVGSTFSFTIPLPEAKRDEPLPPAEPISTETVPCAPKEERMRRLLLAEDDPTIREIFGVLLRRVYSRVDFAENGRKAVEMWQRGEYDLVLMDIQMPLMNGFEATGAIRELERERGFRTPIIALTAHAQKEDEQRCLDAGMDGYISKPIDFQHTLRVMRKIFQQDGDPGPDSQRD